MTEVCAPHDHAPYRETDRSRGAGFKWRCPEERWLHYLKRDRLRRAAARRQKREQIVLLERQLEELLHG